MIKRTGVICMVTVKDMNREDGIRYVDLGNFYELADGSKCVLLSLADATEITDPLIFGHVQSAI